MLVCVCVFERESAREKPLEWVPHVQQRVKERERERERERQRQRKKNIMRDELHDTLLPQCVLEWRRGASSLYF